MSLLAHCTYQDCDSAEGLWSTVAMPSYLIAQELISLLWAVAKMGQKCPAGALQIC